MLYESSSKDQKRILLMAVSLMSAVSIIVLGLTLWMLYRSNFEQQVEGLQAMVRGQVDLIESVTRFDQLYSQNDVSGGAGTATLLQVTDAYSHLKGFGETGEFVLGIRRGDEIEFLSDFRFQKEGVRKIVPITTDRAAPMRRALDNKAGWMIGPDYRGEQVLAAFHPINELSLGMVAKLDMREVNEPFMKVAVTALSIAAFMVFIGGLLVLRMARPMVHRIEESQQRFRTLLESAPDVMVIIDEAGKIVMVNRRMEEVFGYSRNEIMGQPIEKLMPQRFREQHIEHTQSYFRNPSVRPMGAEFELFALSKTSREFPVEISLSPIETEDGILVVSSLRDITERKRAAEELTLAKKKAEEATQAKGDFLANMSHEIRTPMNAIIGMSHLCLGTELQPRQKDYIEKVYQSAQSLLGIINDILDFSKIEAGKLEMEAIPFRLDEVLGNLGNLIAIKAQEKGLELLFDSQPTVPGALIGDPLRLGQILLNLSGNALKFTEEGEIIIRTELIRITDDEVEIRFSVKDSGIGMTPDQVDKLFQSFSQADTSTTRKYGGTGLGLTISKKLTELMKGKIWVESESGKGSSFIFTAVFGRALDMEKTIEKKRPADIEKLKVLVVDDVESARDMLKATLESFSFRVTCVDSGLAALGILEAVPHDDPFQLVLMDWRMPGMDGIETSKRIKQHSTLINIPTIIMVTAYGREEVMHQAEQAGLEGFLIKPMTPSTLLDTIMGVFGDKGGFRKGGGSDKDWEIKTVEALQGCHVLVAEDNKINQQVARELLTQAGLTVSIANNGKEAVERVSRESFDAVLMDMQMPEMDGFEATEVIRLKSKFKDLPIIAMTANAMTGDREKCLAAGMNDHIPKPIDPDLLFKTLAQWVTPGKDQIGVERLKQGKTNVTADSLPTHLVGIDTDKGLKNVGGNRTLYQKLLVDFYQDHHDDLNGIDKAIKEGHSEIAQRMTHTIKGVAGTIGASNLYSKAEQLDAALKNLESDRYEELLADMEKSMTDVMKSLKNLAALMMLQEEKTYVNSTVPIDLDFVLNTLNELDTLFEEMDPDAVDKIYLLNEQLKKSQYAVLFGKLTKQVEELEYEDASETLSLLTQTIIDSQGKEL